MSPLVQQFRSAGLYHLIRVLRLALDEFAADNAKDILTGESWG